jgi:hypothetical protein
MDQTYTITNESCYNILDVLVDGVSQGPIGSYVFAPVFEPHTIHADFALKTFTLTATAGPNGSISPSGTFSVDCGSDQEFTVTADPCFNISNVIINGTEHLGAQQSPFSYTFTNVTADQSIHATFAIKTFPITATAGMGGSISPSGIMYVPCGYDQTYTITNQTCYSISDVLVDGVSVGPVRNYTFTNVIEPHTIEARFVPRGPFTITSSSALIDADGNLLANPGRISPEGIVTVPCGGSQTYTMTSIYSVGNTEYRLSEVRIDGLPVGVINPYTFTNVQNNHTIIAIYTTACQVVTGRITNSTGHLVGGLRVELYDRPGTTLIRYTFSLPDGTYTLPAPIGSQDRFRVKLPNVLTPSWTTSSWILTYSGGGPSRSGTGEMTGEFNINQASQCNAIINWVGVGISR